MPVASRGFSPQFGLPETLDMLKLAKTIRRSIVPFMALVLIGYCALVQLAKWPARLRYLGEEDAAEGTQLSEMVHLRRGVHIYALPRGGRFDGAIYGPLCYLVGAKIVNPDQPSYAPLRLLSLAATIGLAIAAAIFAFKSSHNKLAALLAPLILFANAFIGRYGISARADMVALLLAFLGFLIAYSFRDSGRVLLLSAPFMLTSLFYKQQFVAAPLAVFAYLLISKRFRQCFEFVTIMTVGAVIMVVIFSRAVFSHQAFLLHFFSYNRLPFDKDLVLPEVLMFVIPLFVPLLAAADFLTEHPDKLTGCYVGSSVAVYFLFLLSSGSGADTNRCLEITVVLSCLFAARIATEARILPALTWIGALGLTLGVVALLGSSFVVPQVRPMDFSLDGTLQSYLKENFPPGTSTLGYYAGDPVRAGLDAPVTNLWHYSALTRNGMLPDDEVVSRIRNGGYGLILLDFDLGRFSSSKLADFYTTPSMRQAILSNYEPIARLTLPGPEVTRYSDGSIYVWVPRHHVTPQPTPESGR